MAAVKLFGSLYSFFQLTHVYKKCFDFKNTLYIYKVCLTECLPKYVDQVVKVHDSLAWFEIAFSGLYQFDIFLLFSCHICHETPI